MKDDAARKFLASILTLVITAIPTWQSQHEAYIAARLKLITRLQKETILAALINDHERRHGQKITADLASGGVCEPTIAPPDKVAMPSRIVSD